MSSNFTRLALAALVTLAAARPALAVDTFVAAQTDVNYGFFVNTSDAPRWQAFTLPQGTLNKVGLFINDEHYTDSLLRVSLTDAGGATLWSTQVADQDVPSFGWLELETGGVPTAAGSYRLNVSVNKVPGDGQGLSVFWMGSTVPTNYFGNDTTPFWPTYSYAFSVTSAVPEPALPALWASGAGLLWLLGIRRRRCESDGRGALIPSLASLKIDAGQA
jgi:hypothetical protein